MTKRARVRAPELRGRGWLNTGGKELSLAELRGRIVILAFISKAACHTGHSLELIDGIMLDVGRSHVRSIACIVDLERGERPRRIVVRPEPAELAYEPSPFDPAPIPFGQLSLDEIRI